MQDAIASGALGGLLYDVTWLPNAAFVLMAGVALLAVWPSLRLPGRLLPSAASWRSGAADSNQSSI